MSFSGLDAVNRPYDGLPVADSILTSQSHGSDGARAHEGGQAGKKGLSVVICIKVTALLWT